MGFFPNARLFRHYREELSRHWKYVYNVEVEKVYAQPSRLQEFVVASVSLDPPDVSTSDFGKNVNELFEFYVAVFITDKLPDEVKIINARLYAAIWADNSDYDDFDIWLFKHKATSDLNAELDWHNTDGLNPTSPEYQGIILQSADIEQYRRYPEGGLSIDPSWVSTQEYTEYFLKSSDEAGIDAQPADQTFKINLLQIFGQYPWDGTLVVEYRVGNPGERTVDDGTIKKAVEAGVLAKIIEGGKV